MPKKAVLIINVLAIVFLIFVNVRMYMGADARILAGYGACKVIAFTAILATLLLGIRQPNKMLIALTVLTIIADVALSRILIKDSPERFLYEKNERAYHRVVSKIVDKGLTGPVTLGGTDQKLYIGYVYVERLGDDIAVCFSMGRPGVRSQIVYTDDKKALQDLLKADPEFEALDNKWWIVRYGH